MHARSGYYVFPLAALLCAASASAQWVVHVRQPTGTWEQGGRPTDSEYEAYNQARRMCIMADQNIAARGSTPQPPAVKVFGPGEDPDKSRVIPCGELGDGPGAPEPAGPPAGSSEDSPDPVPVAQPAAPRSGMPSLTDLRRNPLDALRQAAGSLTGDSTQAAEPVVEQASASARFDVVGVSLGMTPAAADKAVREHMAVGWVYVRDRTRVPKSANTYEFMKGYVAADLSEVIQIYFEPSLVDGTLVGVRRFSMIGKSVDPAPLEAALIQKYGAPAVTNNNNWVWGEPGGCSATGTGVLELRDLNFLEGEVRSDPAFERVIGSALDLATYNTPVNREYWANCGPVLAVLKTRNNGVMTTLADQKFTMDNLAAERYDEGEIAF